jgi:hypothetical protein
MKPRNQQIKTEVVGAANSWTKRAAKTKSRTGSSTRKNFLAGTRAYQRTHAWLVRENSWRTSWEATAAVEGGWGARWTPPAVGKGNGGGSHAELNSPQLLEWIAGWAHHCHVGCKAMGCVREAVRPVTLAAEGGHRGRLWGGQTHSGSGAGHARSVTT